MCGVGWAIGGAAGRMGIVNLPEAIVVEDRKC